MSVALNNVVKMKICDPLASDCRDEREVLESLLPFEAAAVLELGCGRAEKTRTIAEAGKVASITAMEVDRIQHAANLRITDLPQVTFALGGAEAIPAADAQFDIVLMFKSLHHVPLDKMDRAMAEILRVMRPGGLLYVSEPVFAGEYNEIIRIFHDEQAVREEAFASIVRAISAGLFDLVEQEFFDTEIHFDSFEQFEARVIKVTHTDHRLSPELYDVVRRMFMSRLGPQGVSFRQPLRVDLLRRPR